MLPEDLSDLLRLYAQRGVADWQKAPSGVRRRAEACLGAEIADHPAEAVITLNTVYDRTNANQLRFIPMPKHPAKGGIEWSFFIPVCEFRGALFSVAFELFLLVSGTDCLAYRFEQAHPPPSTHNYGHVQMSQALLRKTILATTHKWIPVRYPAHPLGTSDPLRMFLAMATAMHGYSNGVLRVIQEIYQAASRAGDAARYVDELQKMLA